jgi:hypothetical protein
MHDQLRSEASYAATGTNVKEKQKMEMKNKRFFTEYLQQQKCSTFIILALNHKHNLQKSYILHIFVV